MCSLQRLAEEIQLGMHALVLIDIRPTAQYSVKHVVHAENLNLSKIVTRRLMKSIVSFKSMLQNSPSLLDKLGGSQRPRIVLYDFASSAISPQADLLRHAEVFESCCGTAGDVQRCSDVYILDGQHARLFTSCAHSIIDDLFIVHARMHIQVDCTRSKHCIRSCA